jgi:hypothetical protein
MIPKILHQLSPADRAQRGAYRNWRPAECRIGAWGINSNLPTFSHIPIVPWDEIYPSGRHEEG